MQKDLIPYTKQELLDNYWKIIRENANEFGDKEFIVTRHGSLTFSQVSSVSDHIANHLRLAIGEKNVGVGIFLRDPRQVIPCMVGVLKSSNYFSVIDHEFPQSSISSMVKDANIRVLIVSNESEVVIKKLVDPTVKLVNINSIDLLSPVEPIDPLYLPGDWVQVMFTSGSTGLPKGAVEDYRYLTRSSYVKLLSYDLIHEDKVLQLSSLSYSGPHTWVFAALVFGFTICYHPVKTEGFSGLVDWMREQKVTIFTGNPTTYRSFASLLSANDVFPSVTTVYLGGDKRLPNDILSIKEHFPKVKDIRLSYTGTEMQAVCSTMATFEEAMSIEVLPSGHPFDDIEVIIADENGNPLPLGQEGEIVIHGDSLARGYINRPELTSSKFIPDPQKEHWQYFKTGDLGKILPDGQLLHLGRLDHMVKIRGVRIELESLENHLLSFPGITNVATKVITDEKGDKKLAAYYLAEKATSIPTSELRKHLIDRFPIQQIPNYLIGLDKFPLTVSGKIAYEKLPLPVTRRPDLANPYVAPTTDTQQALADIWQEHLGLSQIGVTDDFFDLGGDSLLGAIIFAAIEEKLSVNLPVSTLLKAPTIEQLARVIDENTTSQFTSPLIQIRPGTGGLPLFFIPGRGGFPTRVRHLARNLSPDMPVFALQDLRDMYSGRNTTSSIEEVAAYFLQHIRQTDVKGPIILVGESLGGKVAFEIAQQLKSQGDPLPLLILLDTYHNGDYIPDKKAWINKIKYYQMLMKKHWSIWSESSAQGRKEYLAFYRATYSEKVAQFIKKRRPIQKPRSTDIQSTLAEIERVNQRISRRYKLKPYSGKIVYIKALRGALSALPANGWENQNIGDLQVFQLDCYHGSMLFEPAVVHLAEIVQRQADQFVSS